MPKQKDDFELFQKELLEALKNFKRLSPQKQQFHLQRLANLVAAQNDEFIKGILQKLFDLFQKSAKQTEVQNETIETAADLEALKTAATAYLSDVEEIQKGQLENIKSLEAINESTRK